jgi:hypothetical protein
MNFAKLHGLKRLLPAGLRGSLRRWIDSGDAFDIEPSADAIGRIHEYYRADNDALWQKRGIRL